MCGRFTLRTPIHVLVDQFLLSQTVEIVPRYNIAPTQDVAVVRLMHDDPSKRELVTMRWGLVPSWAKDLAMGARMINARCETVAEKPSFRSAFRSRRCLILADGYYEWQRDGRKKRPFWIHRIDDRPFAMAGLWERWSGGGTTGLDSPLQSCTILTTDANAVASTVHDRMPVILPEQHIDEWLREAQVDQAWLSRFLGPSDGSSLRADAMNDYVNNARNEGPRCLEPAAI